MNCNRFIMLIAGLALTGCAAPNFTTKVTLPANFTEPSRFTRIAVLPFDGKQGSDMATEVEGMLAAITLNDKQHFELIDRQSLAKVMDEMKFGQSGLVDPKTAAKIGKMVGANGIYTGKISEYSHSDSHYSEKRREKKREYTVSCTKRQGHISFTPKLVEVSSGKIIYANNIKGTKTDYHCSDSESSLDSVEDIMRGAKADVLNQMRKDVAPFVENVVISVVTTDEGLGSNAALEAKLESSIQFAKLNRMERACEMWDELIAAAPSAPAAIHNKGLCHEIAGRFTEALQLYKKSEKLIQPPTGAIMENVKIHPSKIIAKSIDRVNDAIKRQNKLKSQQAAK